MLATRRHQTETGRHGVQAEAVALLRKLGCLVLRLPVRMTGGYRLMPKGTPDTIVFLGSGRFGWLEFKRAKGGKLSPEQEAFRDAALRRGENWAEPTSAEEAAQVVMGWRTG